MSVDVREGSISLDFAKGAVSFADYHYYDDLAAEATYTPTAQAFGMFQGENVGTTDLHPEFHDGGDWVKSECLTKQTFFFFQDNGQNMRIKNDDIVALKISLTGGIWSTGLTDYHYYADLASGATYTPTAQAFGMFQGADVDQGDLHPEFHDGAAWVLGECVSKQTFCFFQDNSQNMRIKNDDLAVALKMSLTGGIWS